MQSSRRRPVLPLVLTGLSALLVAQMAARDPRYLVPFAVLGALMLVPTFLARRRMRRLLMSGDVERVLGTWEESGLARTNARNGAATRVMYAETMVPLMAAIAYAAYGWVEEARRALSRAAKGPAWDAAIEQRLFVEALLDTYEGERDQAMRKAEALERMPMPSAAGWLARRKVQVLRAGIAALARAFAHQPRKGDGRVLRAAGKASPLIHWAMRYAAAVVAIDAGREGDVPALLAGAPPWPAQSAFRTFHDELHARIAGVA